MPVSAVFGGETVAMSELDIVALLSCMTTCVAECAASSPSKDDVGNAMDSILSAVAAADSHPNESLDNLFAMTLVVDAAGRTEAPHLDNNAEESSPSDSAETVEMARLLRSSVQLEHQVRLKRQMTMTWRTTSSPLEPCLEVELACSS